MKTRTKTPPAKIKKSELPELLVSIANELDKTLLALGQERKANLSILDLVLRSLRKKASDEIKKRAVLSELDERSSKRTIEI